MRKHYRKQKKKVIKERYKKLFKAITDGKFRQFQNYNYKLNPKDIDFKDAIGNTLLYYAIKHQRINFVSMLLLLGADQQTSCVNGETPEKLANKLKNKLVSY